MTRARLLLAAVTAGLVLLPAGVARADTSAATANAAWVTTAGITVTSGTEQVSNDGEQGTVTSSRTPSLGVMSGQTLVTAGTLVQRAVAYDDGRSAACAGLVGSGGSIRVDSAGACAVTVGTGGVVLSLSTAVKVKADAVTASCTASSEGTVSGSASLVNAGVYVSGVKTLALSAAPAPNTGVAVSALGSSVANLLLDQQVVDRAAGKITVGALWTGLVGSAVTSMIGTVSCGGNVRVLPTPALPLHLASLSGAFLAVATWVALARRHIRRRLLLGAR